MKKKINIQPYIFILPFYLGFLLLKLGPILFTIIYSLGSFKGNIYNFKFEGIKNYIILFKDKNFLISLKNTFTFTIVQSILVIGLAIFLAIIIDNPKLRFTNIFKSIFFFPVITSLIVAALGFYTIFDPYYGLLNYLLKFIGIGPISWLTDSRFSLFSIILVTIWRWMGFYFVIILAGLKNIPQQYYDAARVDGANTFQVIKNIKLPLLRPVILFCVVIQIIGALQLFEEPWILTRGGPSNSTLTIMINLYQEGFINMSFGYASAIALILILITFIISITQFKIFKFEED